MRTEAQTSMHLLMVSTLSILSVLLGLITLTMSWELWTVPMMVAGCLVVWWLHIGRVGSEMLYENICTGLLMMEFFFFGVHESSLFDIPLVACIVLLLLSLLNRKRLLYLAVALYVFQMLYHLLLLGTIGPGMRNGDVLRMAMGASAVMGSLVVARYRINRRRRERARYDTMQEQLATAVRQNADFPQLRFGEALQQHKHNSGKNALHHGQWNLGDGKNAHKLHHGGHHAASGAGVSQSKLNGSDYVGEEIPQGAGCAYANRLAKIGFVQQMVNAHADEGAGNRH